MGRIKGSTDLNARHLRLSIPLTDTEKKLYETTAQLIAKERGYPGAGTVTVLRELLNEFMRDYMNGKVPPDHQGMETKLIAVGQGEKLP